MLFKTAPRRLKTLCDRPMDCAETIGRFTARYMTCDLCGYLGITRSIIVFLRVSLTRVRHFPQSRSDMFEHYGFTGAWSTCFTRCKCWCCRQSFANFLDFQSLSCCNKVFANVQSGTMVARHFKKNLNMPPCITRLTIEYMH